MESKDRFLEEQPMSPVWPASFRVSPDSIFLQFCRHLISIHFCPLFLKSNINFDCEHLLVLFFLNKGVFCAWRKGDIRSDAGEDIFGKWFFTYCFNCFTNNGHLQFYMKQSNFHSQQSFDMKHEIQIFITGISKIWLWFKN